jgi:PAS domain S-box-containing protein
VAGIALSFFLALLAGLAWHFARWSGDRPISLWLWAWGFLVASGACGLLGESVPWVLPLMHLLGPFFPALLLAGALAHANAAVPRWLIPATIVVGTFRWGLAQAGLTALSHGVSLAVEPTAELAAAVVIFRYVRGSPASRAERLLAPAFVAVALVDLAAAAWGTRTPGIPPPLFLGWILVGTSTVGIQVTVALEQRRRRERQVEEALSDSEERFRALTENAFDLIAETDADGTLTYTNPRLEEVLGCTRGALIGARFADRIHPEDRGSATRWHRELVESKSPPPILARWRHEDGGWRWIESAGRAFSATDASLCVVVCACDVTLRKEMEEELRQARLREEQQQLEIRLREVQRLQSLGVLAGRIAHDFNNLLTVILGNSARARQELGPDSPAAEQLDRIQTAARHAAEVVDQMLTYSGKASVKPDGIQLSGLVAEILELLQVSSSKNATLETDLDEHLPLVNGDATQLRQVIVNLITNASEALGKRKGTISVSTGVVAADGAYLADAYGAVDPNETEYVYLEVADSGCGIDEATQARIFEPFYSTKVSGRGLGLAAALGIVQGHRGVIKLTSEPGRGTTFRVLLPRAQPVAEVVPEEGESPPAPRTGGTVLVIDDEAAVLELAGEFLKRAGFEVVAASGGREAVEIFRARAAEIDAIVLDLIMPDFDGEETFKEIRRIQPDIPVILMTGYAEEKAVDYFAARDVSAFIRKPYEPEALVESVRAALARR